MSRVTIDVQPLAAAFLFRKVATLLLLWATALQASVDGDGDTGRKLRLEAVAHDLLCFLKDRLRGVDAAELDLLRTARTVDLVTLAQRVERQPDLTTAAPDGDGDA